MTQEEYIRDFWTPLNAALHAAMGGHAPQMQQAAVQVNPVEELFWICRRASLQGWKVRKERSQAGLQVVFVRQRGMVIDEVRGGLHMDWNCALTDACHAVECFLE